MKYCEVEDQFDGFVVEEPRELGKRTLEYALRVVRLYRSLPSSPDAQVIGKQLLRSGTSIGANFRETKRAQSDSEFLFKLSLCLQGMRRNALLAGALDQGRNIPRVQT